MPADPAILIVSQVYVPDPTSLGQHMHDAAAELARRGFRVVVLTSQTGYDDPKQKYPRRELRDGVEIRRLSWSHFGKRSIALRLLGAAAFLLQAIVRAIFIRKIGGIVVSTSPPIASLAALAISTLRRAPIVYWVMDINPDQAVALGRFDARSLPVRCMEWLNRTILRRAARVVTLDRFMATRLQEKHDCTGRLAVLPPWPLDDGFEPIEHAHNPFRREHALEGKFVVMYSGNMSPAHPLDTVLRAAAKLSHRRELVFLFIGGGLARRQVELAIEKSGGDNLRLLPYQPRERLRESLSAADVHLVSMGDDMVGIVHPCKIYGAMACGRPVLLVGPRESHAGELVAQRGIGWQVAHGDDAELAELLDNLVNGFLAGESEQRNEMGCRARTAIARELGKSALCGALCDEIEMAFAQARFFGTRPVGHASSQDALPESAPVSDAADLPAERDGASAETVRS